MKVQIRNIGNSKGIIIPPQFLKYYELNVGDWIDISDIVKMNKNED